VLSSKMQGSEKEAKEIEQTIQKELS